MESNSTGSGVHGKQCPGLSIRRQHFSLCKGSNDWESGCFPAIEAKFITLNVLRKQIYLYFRVYPHRKASHGFLCSV
jgi:hypothetical protein